MTKEIKILAVSFLLVNLIVYLSLSFVNLSLAPNYWNVVSRACLGGSFIVTFTACVCWILFSPNTVKPE